MDRSGGSAASWWKIHLPSLGHRGRSPTEALPMMNAPSRTFLIQVQVERLLALDEPDIVNVGNRIKTEWLEDCSVTTGDEDGRYVNLMIRSENPAQTWERISESLLGDDFLSTEVKISAIITVTGKAGWDDYLLLHHFDPSESLDAFP